MMATWMLYSIAFSAVLAGAGAFFDRGARWARLPGRWVWFAALLASVSGPLSVVLAPDANARMVGGVSLVATGTPATVSHFPVVPGGPAVSGALAVVWVVVSLAMMAIALSTLARMDRETKLLPADLLEGTPIRRSLRFGPAVVGIVRNQVVIPAWLGRLAPEAEALATVHERAHLSAHDSLVQFVGLVCVMLFPWNPVVWWQFSRLRQAIELDCDARVLRTGADLETYASLLLEIARNRVRSPFPAVALLPTKSQLRRRVMTMADQKRPPSYLRTTLAAALGAVLAVAACETPQPLEVANADSRVREGNLEAVPTPGVEVRNPVGLLQAIGERIDGDDDVAFGEDGERVLPERVQLEWIDEEPAGHLERTGVASFGESFFELVPPGEGAEEVRQHADGSEENTATFRFVPEPGSVPLEIREGGGTLVKRGSRFGPESQHD